jgi:uncharacterized protein YprB with RNaseH-like and TPR domain
MDGEVASLLRRLGVTKGARTLRPAVTAPAVEQRAAPLNSGEPPPLELLLPGGRLLESGDRACFVVDHVYPLHHRHGGDALADLLALDPTVGVTYALDDRIAGRNFRDFLFLDTETTGLAGAGTLAFMVGVAYFEPHPTVIDGLPGEQDVLIVRQYFLRDHGDEPVMLHQLDELLAGKAGLITFNGRSFDVPLLDNRYLLNRRRGRLPDMPHIDLLPPARRLYRARLGSCALAALEQNLLDLRRSQEDVPGWLIPTLYYNYLRSGDARELTRVFYHNEMDMLSMVTLAARIFRLLAESRCDEALDQISLGRWQADLGLNDLAEATLRAILDAELEIEAYHLALHRLTALYKQNGRRAEAVVGWQQIAFTSTSDVSAHVELAKHYEWHKGDVAAALEWTRRALALVERWTPTPRSRLIRAELLHRLDRLQKKAGS